MKTAQVQQKHQAHVHQVRTNSRTARHGIVEGKGGKSRSQKCYYPADEACLRTGVGTKSGGLRIAASMAKRGLKKSPSAHLLSRERAHKHAEDLERQAKLVVGRVSCAGARFRTTHFDRITAARMCRLSHACTAMRSDSAGLKTLRPVSRRTCPRDSLLRHQAHIV